MRPVRKKLHLFSICSGYFLHSLIAFTTLQSRCKFKSCKTGTSISSVTSATRWHGVLRAFFTNQLLYLSTFYCSKLMKLDYIYVGRYTSSEMFYASHFPCTFVLKLQTLVALSVLHNRPTLPLLFWLMLRPACSMFQLLVCLRWLSLLIGRTCGLSLHPSQPVIILSGRVHSVSVQGCSSHL